MKHCLRKSGLWRALPILLCFLQPQIAAGMEKIEAGEEGPGFELQVSGKFQPDFGSSRRYSHAEMQALAEEVLIRMENQLGVRFNRRDPQYVWALAEFFGLTPQEDLEPYSTPMEEGDAYYFSEVDSYQHAELYPQTAQGNLMFKLDEHWTPQGHVAVADAIEAWIQAEGLFHLGKSRGLQR